ncbi:MAG: pyruvate kinase [Zoogloeaceae bacterium]|nr:pyruvate kinase [Zoogloeaceae bacterium]
MSTSRNTKIVATLGPASSTTATIRALNQAGADVFRLNFSHGTHADHAARAEQIRLIAAETGRPIGILADLQGPKLRIGTFADGSVAIKRGERIRFDSDPTPGDRNRVCLPHPEIIAASKAGDELLLDDGRIRLQVEAAHADSLDLVAMNDGTLSNRKGVNVPSATLELSPLTPKDLADLDFALSLGVDWIALSFVQRASDVAQAQALIAGRAALMAKIEKPSAITDIEGILALADGIMVARGDLGVEMPAEEVPGLQKKLVRLARAAGKPVVVATQMLESMVSAPAPTRAEASDVATAVFDGADAVMLSAESASGQYPLEAVEMMARIITRTEADPLHRQYIETVSTNMQASGTDAIGTAIRSITAMMPVCATVAFTASGATALRIAHQRPQSSIVCLTPSERVAGRLTVAWGIRPRVSNATGTVEEMVDAAVASCRSDDLIRAGEAVIVTAGVPFGTPGTTNLLRLAWPTPVAA